MLTALALLYSGSQVDAGPMTPCSADSDAIAPAYANAGASPTIQMWRGIYLDEPETCSDTVRGQMQLVVALEARFESAKSLEELAARLGTVSATEELLYWSAGAGHWRKLISNAYALRAPDPKTQRPDFSAEEVLSGRVLYFAQEDTRSTGLNLYSLSARRLGSDRIVATMVNVTTIRFAVVTMFEPGSLISLHFIERLQPGIWGYYGLSAVRDGLAAGHEASIINRAAAFYRFLREVPGDAEPPLAR